MSSKKIVITSHNLKSNALRELANELSSAVGYRVLRVSPDHVRARLAITFHPGIDKVTQFRAFHNSGVSAPGFSTNYNTVKEDIPNAKQIVARSLISASEGRGIKIFSREEGTPRAPLYTEYVPKKREYRVHVYNNEVIDVAEKRKRRGVEERNTQIRNTANGYVFCRDNVVEPGDLRSLAVSAVGALGRSQGAVDIIFNEKQNKCYVLEVNSRPGMQGSTVKKYADAILRSLA